MAYFRIMIVALAVAVAAASTLIAVKQPADVHICCTHCVRGKRSDGDV